MTTAPEPAPPTGSMLALLRELVRRLARYKWLAVGIIVLGVLEAALVKAPLLLISQVIETLFPGVTGRPNELVAELTKVQTWLLGQLGYPADDQDAMIVGAALLLVVLAALGAAVMYAFRMLANLATTLFIVDLRNDICSHLLSLSLRFFSRQRTGDLISTVSNDTSSIRHAFTLAFENALLEPTLIAGNVVLAWSVSPWLGGFVICMAIVLAVPMTSMGRRVRKGSRKSLAALGDATDTMAQMFGGFRTVKAFQLEAREMQEFAADNQRFLKRTMRMVQAKASSQALLYLIYMLGFAGLLVAVNRLFGARLDEIGANNMGLALAAIGTTYTHVKRAARTYNMLQESQGAMDRIQVHLSQRNEILDQPGARDLGQARGQIEFRAVSFAYAEDKVLHDLSFTIEPGERVAFVGSSGAGKSTILNLLLRFYDPSEGSILIDGKDLRSIRLESWLQHLATVDQQPFLFNASIRENILLGKPGATEAEMRAAAEAAYVEEFVRRLPDGYDTVCGERGSRLSGGQLQRITIARALIRDPVVLLLDEATSSLDAESEKNVQLALNNLMRGRTSIMVAHRLSTVRGADRIFVLERGRIVEEGRHEDLMGRDGAYRRLNLLQT